MKRCTLNSGGKGSNKLNDWREIEREREREREREEGRAFELIAQSKKAQNVRATFSEKSVGLSKKLTELISKSHD